MTIYITTSFFAARTGFVPALTIPSTRPLLALHTHGHLRFRMLIYSSLINKDDFRDVDGFEKSYSICTLIIFFGALSRFLFFASPPPPPFSQQLLSRDHDNISDFLPAFLRFTVLSACGNI
jgi:hypothetical protein